MDTYIIKLIATLGAHSELLTAIEAIVYISTMLLMMRVMQLSGLVTFNAMMIVVANIQVLNVAHFPSINSDIALGNVAFSCTYLSLDTITEHYGKNKAKQAVFIGLITQILIIAAMLLNIAYSPIAEANNAHSAIANVFTPSARICIAGLISYVISELFDIYIFSLLKRITKSKMLLLRTSISTAVAQALDSIMFSVLCWIVLNPDPIPFTKVMTQYVMGSYLIKFLVGLLTSPTIYISHKIKKKRQENVVR